MTDYGYLLDTINSKIKDEMETMVFSSDKESDFEHGKRIGKVMALKSARDDIEELRIQEK
jgi:hypothetical protein